MAKKIGFEISFDVNQKEVLNKIQSLAKEIRSKLTTEWKAKVKLDVDKSAIKDIENLKAKLEKVSSELSKTDLSQVNLPIREAKIFEDDLETAIKLSKDLRESLDNFSLKKIRTNFSSFLSYLKKNRFRPDLLIKLDPESLIGKYERLKAKIKEISKVTGKSQLNKILPSKIEIREPKIFKEASSIPTRYLNEFSKSFPKFKKQAESITKTLELNKSIETLINKADAGKIKPKPFDRTEGIPKEFLEKLKEQEKKFSKKVEIGAKPDEKSVNKTIKKIKNEIKKEKPKIEVKAEKPSVPDLSKPGAKKLSDKEWAEFFKKIDEESKEEYKKTLERFKSTTKRPVKEKKFEKIYKEEIGTKTEKEIKKIPKSKTINIDADISKIERKINKIRNEIKSPQIIKPKISQEVPSISKEEVKLPQFSKKKILDFHTFKRELNSFIKLVSKQDAKIKIKTDIDKAEKRFNKIKNKNKIKIKIDTDISKAEKKIAKIKNEIKTPQIISNLPLKVPEINEKLPQFSKKKILDFHTFRRELNSFTKLISKQEAKIKVKADTSEAKKEIKKIAEPKKVKIKAKVSNINEINKKLQNFGTKIKLPQLPSLTSKEKNEIISKDFLDKTLARFNVLKEIILKKNELINKFNYKPIPLLSSNKDFKALSEAYKNLYYKKMEYPVPLFPPASKRIPETKAINPEAHWKKIYDRFYGGHIPLNASNSLKNIIDNYKFLYKNLPKIEIKPKIKIDESKIKSEFEKYKKIFEESKRAYFSKSNFEKLKAKFPDLEKLNQKEIAKVYNFEKQKPFISRVQEILRISPKVKINKADLEEQKKKIEESIKILENINTPYPIKIDVSKNKIKLLGARKLKQKVNDEIKRQQIIDPKKINNEIRSKFWNLTSIPLNLFNFKFKASEFFEARRRLKDFKEIFEKSKIEIQKKGKVGFFENISKSLRDFVDKLRGTNKEVKEGKKELSAWGKAFQNTLNGIKFTLSAISTLIVTKLVTAIRQSIEETKNLMFSEQILGKRFSEFHSNYFKELQQIQYISGEPMSNVMKQFQHATEYFDDTNDALVALYESSLASAAGLGDVYAILRNLGAAERGQLSPILAKFFGRTLGITLTNANDETITYGKLIDELNKKLGTLKDVITSTPWWVFSQIGEQTNAFFRRIVEIPIQKLANFLRPFVDELYKLNKVLLMTSPYTKIFDKLVISVSNLKSSGKFSKQFQGLFDELEKQKKIAQSQSSTPAEAEAALQQVDKIKKQIAEKLQNIPGFKEFASKFGLIGNLSKQSASNLEKLVSALDRTNGKFSDLAKNFEEVKDKASNFSVGLKTSLVLAIPLLIKFGSRVLYLIPGLNKIGAISKIASMSITKLSLVLAIIGGIIISVKDNISGAGTAFNDFIRSIGNLISAIGLLQNSFSDTQKVFSTFSNIINNIKNTIGQFTTVLFKSLTTITDIITGILMIFSGKMEDGKKLIIDSLIILFIEIKKLIIEDLGNIGKTIARGVIAAGTTAAMLVFATGNTIKDIFKITFENLGSIVKLGFKKLASFVSDPIKKAMAVLAMPFTKGSNAKEKFDNAYKSIETGFNKISNITAEIKPIDPGKLFKKNFIDAAALNTWDENTKFVASKLTFNLGEIDQQVEKQAKEDRDRILKSFSTPISGFDFSEFFKNISRSINNGTSNINARDLEKKLEEVGKLYENFMDELMANTMTSADYNIYKIGASLSKYAELVRYKMIKPTQLATLYMKELMKQSSESLHAMVYGIKSNPLVKELQRVGQLAQQKMSVEHTIKILMQATGTEHIAKNLSDDDYKLIMTILMQYLAPMLKGQVGNVEKTININNGIGTHTAPIGG